MPNAIQCLGCCGTYVGCKLKLESSRNPSNNFRSPSLAQNRRRGFGPLFAAIESDSLVHSLGILCGGLVLVQDEGVRLDVVPVEL